MNQHQLQIIDYLREENRVLREQINGRRVRFNDDQRRRLGAKAKTLGRKLLAEVATIVTPESLASRLGIGSGRPEADGLAGTTNVNGCSGTASVPEPGSAGLVSLSCLLGILAWRKFRVSL